MNWISNQVITTSNMNWVSKYSLIEALEILKRDDEWWGGHEYTRWPQFFCSKAIHHAFIPSFSTQASEDLHSEEDVVLVDPRNNFIYEVIDEKGKVMNPRTNERLYKLDERIQQRLCLKLEKWGAMTYKVESGVEVSGARDVYERCMKSDRNFVEVLQEWYASCHKVLFMCQDVQRVILKLRELYNYILELQGVDRGAKEASTRTIVMCSHWGAFTTNPIIASTLSRFRVLVWLISSTRAISPNLKSREKVTSTSWLIHLFRKCFTIKDKSILYNWRLQNLNIKKMVDSQLMKKGETKRLLNMMYKFSYYFSSSTKQLHDSCSSFDLPTLYAVMQRLVLKPLQLQQVSVVVSSKRRKKNKRHKSEDKPLVNHARKLVYIPEGSDKTLDLSPFRDFIRKALNNRCKARKASSAIRFSLPPSFLLIKKGDVTPSVTLAWETHRYASFTHPRIFAVPRNASKRRATTS